MIMVVSMADATIWTMYIFPKLMCKVSVPGQWWAGKWHNLQEAGPASKKDALNRDSGNPAPTYLFSFALNSMVSGLPPSQMSPIILCAPIGSKQ